MARTLIKTARKPKRVAATKIKSIEHRFIGDEPITVTDDSYTNALGWYTYMYEGDHAREFLITYLKSIGAPKNDIEMIRKCPKDRIIPTVGWQARMMFNGNKLSARSLQYFADRLNQMIAYGRQEAPVSAPDEARKPTIQEKTASKNKQIFFQCENEILDQYLPLYPFLIENECTPAAAAFIKAKIEPLYQEVMSDDPEVQENFGKRLKIERTYWQTVMDDLDRYLGNKKVTKVRKPRARKTKAAIDVVKNLKFQKEDPRLKIVSINPAEIVGAQQLWVFNTAARKLTKFVAIGPAGLSVKGTSIIGFDPEQSLTKRVRKPDEMIAKLLSAGKVGLRNFMNEIKATGFPTTGRINSDTVLIRVLK